MTKTKFSIVIPAHNEEKYLPKCLQSIKEASAPYPGQVEIIVVLNRCTDRTETIAKAYGCLTVKNEDKNLSKIRNAGAKLAKGEILVTIDADTCMTPNFLKRAERCLSSGLFIGGGTNGVFDRMSVGIMASVGVLSVPILLKHGPISIGIFWCYKKDFDAIGGFDESILMAEDCDFARRLAIWGIKNRKVYGTIPLGMITSSRKFDKLGDWVLLKRPGIIRAFLREKDEEFAEELYYGFEREE